jgi:Mrp family chromosome partitioning ATPase/capsular polysaccharide biosynthesis protein
VYHDGPISDHVHVLRWDLERASLTGAESRSKGDAMKDAGAQSTRLEPTVFGAIRRYRLMVLVITLAAMVGAVAYARITGGDYRAEASVTVPIPQSLQGQDPAQYLDSQVLLLQSPAVAQLAASMANATLHSNSLSAHDFYTNGGSATVSPPAGATAGAYGASIIGIGFKSTSPEVAQVAANSLIQAFEQQRSTNITNQFNNTIAGIDSAINATVTASQRAALEAQRTQALVNEQADLSQQPTVAWAIQPTKPIGGGWKRYALYGLVVGLVLGAGAAYLRASLRRRLGDRQDPAVIYGVPLLGEIPAFKAGETSRSGGKPLVSARPRSAAAEAFRFTAGSIERLCTERGGQLALVFVSPLADAGKSTVVANLALVLAEGGTRVLAVDANAADGALTAQLLSGAQKGSGLEEALTGQVPLASCIQPSPLDGAVGVLGVGSGSLRRLAGAARSKAVVRLLATAKASFDVVLIDGPALLQDASAGELAAASDAAIIVVGPDEAIQDHLDTVERLRLIGSDVVGYVYNRAPMPHSLAHYRGSNAPAGPAAPPASGLPALLNDVPVENDTMTFPQQPRR